MAYKVLDLFSGAGGLSRGFYDAGYDVVLGVDFDEAALKTFKENHGKAEAMKLDLFDHSNIDVIINFLEEKDIKLDVLVGGPPCQGFSVAGPRDMNDKRNTLYTAMVKLAEQVKPQAVAKVNASDYGVPQNRERMIIVGVDAERYDNTQQILSRFYGEILPEYKVSRKITVREAIGDLPACRPFYDEEHHKKRKSHDIPETNITWHKPRYHNLRDMDTFKILALDIETGRREYDSKKISELYEKKVGSKSPIHRYHVLEPDLPSTTIIAHLYKDGNRFIHYDSSQSRSITVREAARLQSFDDDFDFVGSQGNAYQMIGNAVPPQLAKRVALALSKMLDEIE